MAPTPAQRRAREKWLTEKVDTVTVRIPKGKKEIFKAHADKNGESLNAFLIRAAEATVERESEE